jgi:hypothetical protein
MDTVQEARAENQAARSLEHSGEIRARRKPGLGIVRFGKVAIEIFQELAFGLVRRAIGLLDAICPECARMAAHRKRQFLSRAELRAIELGPAELMHLLEWELRNRPKFVLVGTLPRYLKSDLDAFLLSCTTKKKVSPNVGRPPKNWGRL